MYHCSQLRQGLSWGASESCCRRSHLEIGHAQVGSWSLRSSWESSIFSGVVDDVCRKCLQVVVDDELSKGIGGLLSSTKHCKAPWHAWKISPLQGSMVRRGGWIAYSVSECRLNHSSFDDLFSRYICICVYIILYNGVLSQAFPASVWIKRRSPRTLCQSCRLARNQVQFYLIISAMNSLLQKTMLFQFFCWGPALVAIVNVAQALSHGERNTNLLRRRQGVEKWEPCDSPNRTEASECRLWPGSQETYATEKQRKKLDTSAKPVDTTASFRIRENFAVAKHL